MDHDEKSETWQPCLSYRLYAENCTWKNPDWLRWKTMSVEVILMVCQRWKTTFSSKPASSCRISSLTMQLHVRLCCGVILPFLFPSCSYLANREDAGVLGTVLQHEIGHLLDLSHSSQSDTMNANYNPQLNSPALQDNDLTEVKNKYGMLQPAYLGSIMVEW